MYTRKLVLLVTVTVLIAACSAINDGGEQQTNAHKLENTTWVHFFNECCADTIIFYDAQHFYSFYCELEDIDLGNYYYVGDTLKMERTGGMVERSFKELKQIEITEYDWPKSETVLYDLVIENGKLRFVNLYQWKDSSYKKSDWVFDSTYVFRQIK